MKNKWFCLAEIAGTEKQSPAHVKDEEHTGGSTRKVFQRRKQICRRCRQPCRIIHAPDLLTQVPEMAWHLWYSPTGQFLFIASMASTP